MCGDVTEKVLRFFVKSVVGEMGAASRIHFLGFVSTDELAWLYSNAMALVYPLFSGPENVPLLEAFP